MNLVMNTLLFLLLGLFWSLSFLAIKITVVTLPPLMAAFLRVLVAQIAFTTLFLFTRQKLKVSFSSIWRLWVAGIFLQGIPFALLFFGETYIAAGLASIINSTVGIWAMIFSILIFKDYSQATLTKITGLTLGVLGVLIISSPDIMHSQQHNKLIGILAVVGMAMSYAFGALLNQKLNTCAHKTSLKASLWHQHWGSLVFLLILASSFEHWQAITPLFYHPQVIVALLYLGIFSTAIAWFIYVHLIHTWGTIRASTVLFMMPILALLWDRLFLHLAPSTLEIYGVVVILMGVALIQFSKKKKLV